MKYKGGINFYKAVLSSDFLIKNRNGSALQKFKSSFKYYTLLFLFFATSIAAFSNSSLPKATLTNTYAPIPFAGTTGHVNITVGTATTTGGTWAGTGDIGSPYTFTPNGTYTATIKNTDLATAISTYAYVQITTASVNGSSSGTVIFETSVNSTSSLIASNYPIRKFIVTAYSTITASNSIALTTSLITGNENFNSSNIEFTSQAGNIIIKSTLSTSPSVSFSTALSKGVSGGGISLTASAGTISITSSGS